MILAIDLDGVIHNPNDVEPGKKMGRPIEGAQEALENLTDQGHTIIIHTVRGDSQHVRDWLEFYGLDDYEVTSTKPNADLYIDDKAMKFESWPQVMAYFPEEE